jgi:hypothetical protein
MDSFDINDVLVYPDMDSFDINDVLVYPDMNYIVTPILDESFDCVDMNITCTLCKIFTPLQCTDKDGKTHVYDHIWLYPRLELTPKLSTRMNDLESVFVEYSRRIVKNECESKSKSKSKSISMNMLMVCNQCLYSFHVRCDKLLVQAFPITDSFPKRDSEQDDSVKCFDESDIQWLDYCMNLEATSSPDDDDDDDNYNTWWYKLPKEGDIAGMITATVKENCKISLHVAGENKWTQEHEHVCVCVCVCRSDNKSITLPTVINMLKIGEHSVLIQTNSPNVKITVKYRLFRDVHVRKDLALSSHKEEDGLQWFEAKPPPEWIMAQ